MTADIIQGLASGKRSSTFLFDPSIVLFDSACSFSCEPSRLIPSNLKQENGTSQGLSLARSPALTSIPGSSSKKGGNMSTTRPATAAAIHTSSTAISRRGKKRKKRRRRGGPRIFRRGDYGWLTSCVEPRPWEPKLKLLDCPNSCDGEEHGGGRSSASILDTSRSRALTEKNAPRPVLRRGERFNQSEYNPQHRDIPREKDRYPGPKYDPPPGAFGRVGATGGTTGPSASVSGLDRFPRGRLFSEEEVREREATPGPEAYDVRLEHRLEGDSLEMMQGSLKTLESWSSLGVGRTGDWPFDLSSGSDSAAAAASEISRTGKVRKARGSAARHESKREKSSKRAETGKKQGQSRETERLEGVANRTMFGRSRTPCLAGGSAAPEDPRASERRSPTAKTSAKETKFTPHTADRHCSRLSPSSSAAARRGVPCSECVDFEVATAVGTFVAAAASVSDVNLFRRARTTGASVRFGDMPRQRSAPAFSIGRGQRDVTSRLLHTTTAETIYKVARLGRSGKGPTTACPRAGDALTKPRPKVATVVLPNTAVGGSSGSFESRNGHSGVETAAGKEASETGLIVVDGALGTQVKSYRPTSPSFTLAGPRRAATLFHERLRYGGQVRLVAGGVGFLLLRARRALAVLWLSPPLVQVGEIVVFVCRHGAVCVQPLENFFCSKRGVADEGARVAIKDGHGLVY